MTAYTNISDLLRNYERLACENKNPKWVQKGNFYFIMSVEQFNQIIKP